MKDQRGFSLPETMVAMVLLTVGLLGTAEFLTVALRMHQLARGATEATQLAQAKLEELAKANFQTSLAIQPGPGDSLDRDVTNYFDRPESGFTRRWLVSNGVDARLRKVTVRVIPDVQDRRHAAEARLTTVVRSW